MKRFLIAGMLALGCSAQTSSEPTTDEQAELRPRKDVAACAREALARGMAYPSDSDQPFSQDYAIESQVMALVACRGISFVSVPASTMIEAAGNAAELYRGGADWAVPTFAETVGEPGTYVAVGFFYHRKGN